MAFYKPQLVLRAPRARCTASECRHSGSRQRNCLTNPTEKAALPRRLAIGEQMDRFVVSRSHSEAYHPDRRHALWLSIILICFSLTAPAQKTSQPGDTSAPFSTRATHLLGFANAKNNSTGTLSIQDGSLQFQQNGKPCTQVKIVLVRDIF